jgi:hypothetical protein
LAPIHVQLRTEDDVEDKGESKAGCDKAVAYLCGGGEKPGQTSSNLADNGECGELTRGLRAGILADLGELGEEGEREGGHLENREKVGWDSVQSKCRYKSEQAGNDNFWNLEDEERVRARVGAW